MEYVEIISQSGMAHMVNPSPRYTGTGNHLAAGRTQTLCGMHLKPEQAASPDGRKCDFCARERKRLEELNQR